MKSRFHITLVLAALAGSPWAFAAEPAPAPKAEKPAPEAGSRKEIHVRRLERMPEMEDRTFLGVETAAVSPTLIEQLNLPNRAGLVVQRVVPESAAASVLKKHDILLKLNDQILIDSHQLGVLIRNQKDGDEVTLTYMRGGQQATARVKLGKKEAPKTTDVLKRRLPVPSEFPHVEALPLGEGPDREEMERVLALIEPGHRGEPLRMRIDHDRAAGLRAQSVHTDNSNLVYTDDKGSLELVSKAGERTLTAKNPKGEQVFSGRVDTPEQRQAMPADLRERLEKLEAMQDVTFRTDGDFKGVETKVFRSRANEM